MSENITYSALAMDRDTPLGNSQGQDGRRALHVKDLTKLVTVPFDAGTVQYPDANTEVYQFRQGGITGTIVATVTLGFTGSGALRKLASWSAS